MLKLDAAVDFLPDRAGRLKLRWEGFAYHRNGVERYFTDPSALEVRLDSFSIHGHDGMLWVLAIAKWRQLHHIGETHVTLPAQPRSLALMQDLHFLEHLLACDVFLTNESVLWNPEVERLAGGMATRYPPTSKFSPRYIQPIDSDSWAAVLAATRAFFTKDVAGLLGQASMNELMHEKSYPYQVSIGELLLNIACHGSTTPGAGLGFACYRPWPSTYPIIRFACSDVGPGFRGTLSGRSSPDITTDVVAILYGILYRYFNGRDGVFGLYHAMKFIRMLNGRLYIRSGVACVSVDFTASETRRIFDQGYEKPSIGWLARIARCSRVGPSRGTHVVLDLLLPETEHGTR